MITKRLQGGAENCVSIALLWQNSVVSTDG